jgi:hypothetical protein
MRIGCRSIEAALRNDQQQRSYGRDLHLIGKITIVLGKLLARCGGQKMESHRTAIGIELGERRQWLRGKDAAPQQPGSVARAVQWIVPVKEAFALGPIVDPKQRVALAALPEGSDPHRFRNAAQRQLRNGDFLRRQRASVDRDSVPSGGFARHQLAQPFRYVL